MLGVQTKSAGRRISSLFSLGSNKDSSNNSIVSSPTGSPRPTTSQKSSPEQTPYDRLSKPVRPMRHVASAQNLSPNFSKPLSPTNSSSTNLADPGLDVPLRPPPSLASLHGDMDSNGSSGSRPSSRGGSRPSSSGGLAPPGGAPRPRPTTPSDGKKRRSWMPGRASRIVSMGGPSPDLPDHGVNAWVAGLNEIIPYGTGPLVSGGMIPELWNEQGDTFVYLYPQNADRPASFKVDSTVFVASPSLNYLARGADQDPVANPSTPSASAPTSPPLSAAIDRWDDDNDNASTGSARLAEELMQESQTPQELHLYLPVPLNSDFSSDTALPPEDIETLVMFRNLFAFLLGQSLIATKKHPTLFSIFMQISQLLTRFEFHNLDGSTFGEVATGSFANYCDELHLADVRKSREKTIEAIVLGERMRYQPLYNEGFVHGVGKLDDIKHLNSPKYRLINPITQKRLERAFLDLNNRLINLKSRLDDFDFPSMFSGIANSNTAEESKQVDFKAWKASFLNFRRGVMNFYRSKYGAWPPKASSKKNSFEESGLNRQLLRDVYHDFTMLYDMIVDRTSLTNRTTDMAAPTDESSPQGGDSFARALRSVMSEYDRSTPPVQPPIPFDIPILPSITAIRRKKMDEKKERKERMKKLKDSEINELLVSTYNHESMQATPFLSAFMEFERRNAKGKNMNEILDNRCGQWLFMYAVLQSLPMLIVDAPNLRYTEGVESFLCVAPRGGAPWMKEDAKNNRSWFGVAGGAGVVSLPSDVVAHSVEGIYRRSHCWEMATQWADAGQTFGPEVIDTAASEGSQGSPSYASMPPPPPLSSVGSSSDPPAISPPGGAPPNINLPIPRSHSPAGSMARSNNRASIYMGLEALPLPAGVMPIDPPTRPYSRHNPTMSFDDILKTMPQKGKK